MTQDERWMTKEGEVRRVRLINMTGKAGSIKKAGGRRLKVEG